MLAHGFLYLKMGNVLSLSHFHYKKLYFEVFVINLYFKGLIVALEKLLV